LVDTLPVTADRARDYADLAARSKGGSPRAPHLAANGDAKRCTTLGATLALGPTGASTRS
jgi:hypothetical protein